jgi:hypothetical protein
MGLNSDYEFPGIACDIPDILGRCTAQTTGIAKPHRRLTIPPKTLTDRGDKHLTSFFLDIYRTRIVSTPDHQPGSAGTSIPHAQHEKR